MAASGNSRGHVCLRVGEPINRRKVLFSSPWAVEAFWVKQKGSVALNADRSTPSAFCDSVPQKKPLNAESLPERLLGRTAKEDAGFARGAEIDGNAVWPYTRSIYPRRVSTTNEKKRARKESKTRKETFPGLSIALALPGLSTDNGVV